MIQRRLERVHGLVDPPGFEVVADLFQEETAELRLLSRIEQLIQERRLRLVLRRCHRFNQRYQAVAQLSEYLVELLYR
ncbi:hypothetical protein D3C74_290690 [compost metagenome]